MAKSSIILACMLFLASALALHAQQKPITKSASVTATATIVAIDKNSRQVTLRNENGQEDTFAVGPAVTRFDELQVGDKVKMTYYESLIFQVRKPGEAPPVGSPEAETSSITPGQGALPGGTVATQQKMSVLVKAVDPELSAITVLTDDGRVVTRKVEDKKNLEKVKPGDRIDITYTQALVTNIERVK